MGKTELFPSFKSMGLVYMYNILLCQNCCCGILERQWAKQNYFHLCKFIIFCYVRTGVVVYSLYTVGLSHVSIISVILQHHGNISVQK